jgi:hypothetical protein
MTDDNFNRRISDTMRTVAEDVPVRDRFAELSATTGYRNRPQSKRFPVLAMGSAFVVGLLVVGGALLALRAGTTEPSDSVDSAVVTTIPEFGDGITLVIPECPSGADCPRGFTINGEFWGMGCLAIDPSALSDEVIATGSDDVFVSEVRSLVGTDPRVMAAALVSEPRDCEGNLTGLEEGWVAAFGPASNNGDEESARAVSEAICAHGLKPSEADRCDKGGRISWYSDEAGEYRYRYFPEYQEQVDAALSDGGGPEWRLDPSEVAAELWLRESGVCTDDPLPSIYVRCRVGIEATTVEGSTAIVGLVVQWGLENSDGTVWYESYPQTIGLERTERAWWAVSWREAPMIGHGSGDDGRNASDQLWSGCCDTVLVDTENGIAVLPPDATTTTLAASEPPPLGDAYVAAIELACGEMCPSSETWISVSRDHSYGRRMSHGGLRTSTPTAQRRPLPARPTSSSLPHCPTQWTMG